MTVPMTSTSLVLQNILRGHNTPEGHLLHVRLKKLSLHILSYSLSISLGSQR